MVVYFLHDKCVCACVCVCVCVCVCAVCVCVCVCVLCRWVVDLHELRHASIDLLLSMICLPLHFLNQPLPSEFIHSLFLKSCVEKT